LERVEELIQMEDFRNPLNNYLKQIGDLERLISKVAMNKATPRDIVQLKKSQQIVVSIIDWIKNTENTYFKKYLDLLNPCFHLIEKIDLQLIDEAPAVLNKGCVFKKGVDPHLDENLSLMTDGKEYLFEIQQREALRTEITNLKIGFNNVFGYFLEVTNSHKDKVPSDWIRKQTLTGAERYITPELKEYEQKILGAEDRMYQIQDTLWQKLLLDIQEFVEIIQNNSKTLAELDVLACFAQIAIEYDYHCPEINEGLAIDIKQGRHPVIERKMPIDQPYSPNDVYLSNDEQQIILLTGPNMSGKSAVLRQTALIVLMAQMGSFVPAQSAHIGFIDKLFT
jgi:DNA mismatch repair protein MutS